MLSAETGPESGAHDALPKYDVVFLWKVTRKGEYRWLNHSLEFESSIDHCGTFKQSAIDAAHRATETEEEHGGKSVSER